MSTLDTLALVAAIACTVWAQAPGRDPRRPGRFVPSLVAMSLGAVASGSLLPHDQPGTAFVLAAVSGGVIAGGVIALGSRLRIEADGRIRRRDTALTRLLAIGLTAVTAIAAAATESVLHLDAPKGTGPVLMVIAAVLATQTEVLHQRALRLSRALTRIELTA